MEQERKYAYQIIQITHDRTKPLHQVMQEVQEVVKAIYLQGMEDMLEVVDSREEKNQS